MRGVGRHVWIPLPGKLPDAISAASRVRGAEPRGQLSFSAGWRCVDASCKARSHHSAAVKGVEEGTELGDRMV